MARCRAGACCSGVLRSAIRCYEGNLEEFVTHVAHAVVSAGLTRAQIDAVAKVKNQLGLTRMGMAIDMCRTVMCCVAGHGSAQEEAAGEQGGQRAGRPSFVWGSRGELGGSTCSFVPWRQACCPALPSLALDD